MTSISREFSLLKIWCGFSHIEETYDPSLFRHLGDLHSNEINVYLYFKEIVANTNIQMSCHIETTDRVIRFRFARFFTFVGETRHFHTDEFDTISIRKRSKGYKKFQEWWKNFVEKQDGWY